jgi:signal transduction histidine kinase
MHHALEKIVNMELFLHEDELMKLQADLPQMGGQSRMVALLEIAWYQRQREPQFALAQVEQGRIGLVAPDGMDERYYWARWDLIEAEIKWLQAKFELATMQANEALSTFQTLQDADGCFDSHWILARIAVDQGHPNEAAIHLADAERFASAHSLRKLAVQVAQAQALAFRDVRASLMQWKTHFEHQMAHAPVWLRAMIHAYFGVCAAQQSDFGRCAEHLLQAHELAMVTGQVRAGIRDAVNTGDAFSNLNDYQSALEWMQRGLDLARSTGWPQSIAVSLSQTSNVLRYLGRFDAAQELITEALQILMPFGVSRSHVIALEYQADLALAQGDYARALGCFQELEVHARNLQQPDFQTSAWRGQADALSHLGRGEEALVPANAALELAAGRQDAYAQIKILQVLAQIHSQHKLPAMDGSPDSSYANPSLHYLQHALLLAASIHGYTVDGDLLDAVADVYAKAKDFERAFAFTEKASQARASTHSHEATNRAVAMQVLHQTERAKARSEYHRQLALADARRAEVLAQTNAVLARLGAVGQEITAHLQQDVVFEALNRHAHALLEVSSFAIYLRDKNDPVLVLSYGIEQGRHLPECRIEQDDPHSSAAQCWRECRDVLVNLAAADPEPEPDPAVIPGTLTSLTRLFAPLMIGDHLLGVMTVQSTRANAYGATERFIFRTLCAYGAIALDNADAYRQLELAQAQIVEQQKLAALGSLVAGVAQELNTPIGNGLMMSSALHEKADAIERTMQERGLQFAELTQFLEDAGHAADVIIRGLTHAADLVSSFKQVAVDRITAHQRPFSLLHTCNEVVATMINQIKLAGHHLEIDVPPDIMLDSYPGPLGQVITNFISNSLAHAFAPGHCGKMRLAARRTSAERVQITFSDDGVGMAEENERRIFTPFFTSSVSGNGLGLSISHDIVSSLLNGQISVRSSLGSGTVFELDLPLIVVNKCCS